VMRPRENRHVSLGGRLPAGANISPSLLAQAWNSLASRRPREPGGGCGAGTVLQDSCAAGVAGGGDAAARGAAGGGLAQEPCRRAGPAGRAHGGQPSHLPVPVGALHHGPRRTCNPPSCLVSELPRQGAKALWKSWLPIKCLQAPTASLFICSSFSTRAEVPWLTMTVIPPTSTPSASASL
jgi:hypothetical protein